MPEPLENLERVVIEAADAYVASLYSAKFARTVAPMEVEVSEHNAIKASRALVKAVQALREARAAAAEAVDAG